MPINPIRALDGAMKPVNHGLNTPAGNLAEFIEGAVKRNEIDSALSIFKRVLESRTPDFAERVLEGAPFFAAWVAMLAVTEIVKKFGVGEERAGELQKLADKYRQKMKKVSSVQRS